MQRHHTLGGGDFATRETGTKIAACSVYTDYTDDAAMVEALGHSVRVFMGSYENLKVTTPEDLVFVSQLLAEPNGADPDGNHAKSR